MGGRGNAVELRSALEQNLMVERINLALRDFAFLSILRRGARK